MVPGRIGALLISSTVTVNELVALSGGTPLSVTTTVIRFVLGPWASDGVHVIPPVAGLMLMPDGGETRLKVRIFGGRSESEAEAETFKVASSFMVWLAGTVSEGAEFTSLTVTVNELVALSEGVPLSVTTTVMVLRLGPWASVGVQEIEPEAGSMLIPDGGESRLNVSVFAGISGSVAEAETLSVVSSLIV